jgi:cardiolipin-specific phospholipase
VTCDADESPCDVTQVFGTLSVYNASKLIVLLGLILALLRRVAMDSSSLLPPAPEIPSAFTASFKSWWHVGEKQAAISEERLLRRLPFFNSSSSDSPVVATSTRVDLLSPKQYLNTLSMVSTSPSPGAPPPAVMLHGYGAGLGFFFRNFAPLAQWAGRHGSAVYALDWLGMGRSARVPFTVKAKRDDVSARVHEAESFFIDSLEEWRAKMGLDSMTLIGHSLGAYFSVVYALRHPERVNKLILLSPAGVPRGPNFSDPSRELTDHGDGQEEESASATVTRPRELSSVERATRRRISTIRDEQKENKKQESRTRRLFTYLWEEGWSPFQVVRSTLFWGPMLIGKVRSLLPLHNRLRSYITLVLRSSFLRPYRRRHTRHARLYHEHHSRERLWRILHLQVPILHLFTTQS